MYTSARFSPSPAGGRKLGREWRVNLSKNLSQSVLGPLQRFVVHMYHERAL
jgi:hypothetical protein